jgi:PAS domain S-box-containing protein
MTRSERRSTAQALRESEEKFSKAFRASPDGMAISEVATGRYVEVNEGYSLLCGYRREEMIGRTSIELGIWKEPAERERFVVELQQRGRVRDFHMVLGTRAGEVRQILLNGEFMMVGKISCFVSVLHDVTERLAAERALRESEEKFAKAFRTSPDVMSIVDLETGRYVEVNDAHERVFGYQRQEVLGRSPTELGIYNHPAQRQLMQAQLEATGSLRNLEVEAHTARGESLFFLLSAEVIELGGRKCVLRVAHDVTGRKRAEAERAEAVQREQEARIEYTLQLIAAQEAERKRIAAELHDGVGQNLLLIRNLAQQVLQTALPPAAREQLSAIDHLAGLCIADVRQISRDLRPYQLDHLGLKRALEAMLEHVAQASDVEFTSRLEPVDDLFRADAALNLYRIVQEGVNNILKHSRASRAQIAVERDLHEVAVRLEDDGVGFAPDKPGRSGLGLRNIAERVRMLGGVLMVRSAPGQGTRIEVQIPIPEAPPPPG